MKTEDFAKEPKLTLEELYARQAARNAMFEAHYAKGEWIAMNREEYIAHVRQFWGDDSLMPEYLPMS